MQAIKVGNQRVVVDNVTNVSERVSSFLQKMNDGSWGENYYAQKEDTQSGLVVTAYFSSVGESSDYVRFYMDEAEEFLRKFDMLTGITEVK